MKSPDRRYLAWGAGLAIIAALPLFAGFTSIGWELSEIAGFAATLACLGLCGCPVRPRQSTPPVLLSLSRHAVLGSVALGLAALHVVLAVLADHTVLDYLRASSPLYQLAGIAAIALLAALVLTSIERWRRRLWRSHRGFQAQHIVLACVLLVLVAVHVVTANRYTGGFGRRAVFLGVAAGGIALLLQRRRIASAAPQESAAPHRLVFGRHSTLVAGVIAATTLLLVPLMAGRAGIELREPLVRPAQLLPLNFDHGKHVAVNCLVCHHNYADGTGSDNCIPCHRSMRADLQVGAEARFHSFCLNCHRNPEPRFEHHGPVSGCASCHAAPALSPAATNIPGA